MNIAHESIAGGHLDIKETFEKVTSCFYWPGIHGDIPTYCRSCSVCQKVDHGEKVSKVESVGAVNDYKSGKGSRLRINSLHEPDDEQAVQVSSSVLHMACAAVKYSLAETSESTTLGIPLNSITPIRCRKLLRKERDTFQRLVDHRRNNSLIFYNSSFNRLYKKGSPSKGG